MNTDVALLELAEAPASSTRPAAARSDAPRDLDLVSHVPVRMDAVIGQCEMPIAHLMALQAGDLVPLLADLDDPVVLRLNDKPVARGELVAVGDRFGVRITEVL